MRTTHLGAAHVRPGRVTAWVPSDRCAKALGVSPPDERPVTVDQRQHLLAASGSPRPDPAEAPWIGLSGRLVPGAEDAVPAALASFFDRHESLRCDYERLGGEFFRRLLAPGEVEFVALPLGDDLAAAEAHDCLVEHLTASAQPHVWPRAGFVTVESEDSLTLFAAFDHVTFDLVSMHAALDELPLLHAAYARGDGPGPVPAAPPSHLDHAAGEQARLAGLTAEDPRMDVWREVAQAGDAAGLPLSSGVSRGGRWGHELVSMPLATPGETAELDELAGRWGTDLETVLIALMLRAIADQEGPGPYELAGLLKVPGRPPEHARSVGWYAAVVPLLLTVDPTAELRTVCRQVVAARDRSAHGAIPTPLVHRLLPDLREPSLVLGFVDHRRSPAEGWMLNESRALLGRVPADDQMHAWITCLPKGTVFEARHPAIPACSAWVATLTVTMRRALLAELAASEVLQPQ